MPILSKAILKTFFQKNDIPTEIQFASFIDSSLNLLDDRKYLGLKVYDPTVVYGIGDTCVFNGLLYKATAITTGPFDSTKWEKLSFGALNYIGTWSALTNTNPTLASGAGNKGDYYVVRESGTTSIDGISQWDEHDWIVFNGTKWEKVDAVDNQPAINVQFDNGPSGMLATNVQDAIDELHLHIASAENDIDSIDNLKADKVAGGGTNGKFAGLDANGNLTNSTKSPSDYLAKDNSTSFTPTGDYNPSTKKYVDDEVGDKADKVSGAVNGNFAGLDANGNLTDTLVSPSDYLSKTNVTLYNPATAYNPATKKYVDDADNSKADKIAGGGTNGHFAGLDSNGNLTDSTKSPSDYLAKDNTTSYTPSGNFHPSTKKYVDDTVAPKADKVSGATNGHFAGLDSNGNLTDSTKSPSDYLAKDNSISYTPSSNFNPSTKKYVDDSVSTKADKVSGATNGHFAGLDSNGNLTDSTKSPSDYLAKDNSTSYTPGANFHPATKKYVDDQVASVTKTSIGLGNVTNDQQLSFKFYFNNDGPVTNSSTGFIAGLAASPGVSFTPALQADYFIWWYYEIASTAGTGKVEARVLLDTSTQLGIHTEQVNISDQFVSIHGFIRVQNLTAVSHTLQIEFRRQGSPSATVTIRNMRATVIKI